MANTRILIHQNDELIKKINQAYESEKELILARANNVIAVFSDFDEDYSENGSTTAKYNELLENGPQHYIDAAVNKITAEFSTAGITSSAILGIPIAETTRKGNDLIRVFTELQQYLEIKPAYLGLKFALTDIEVNNGLAAIKNEKDLEGLKDTLARQYIDSEVGYDLVAKAERLVDIMNSINDVLRTNNIYNLGELNDFGSFAKFQYPTDRSDLKLEVNLVDIYQYALTIKAKQAF
jgi:hypothetical protein